MNGAVQAIERPAIPLATSPPEARGLARDDVRLLVTTPRGHEHAHFHDLPRLLPPRALVIVNRSATLPASLPATGGGRAGRFVLNLSTRYGRGLWLAEPRRSLAEPGPIALDAGEEVEAAGLTGRMVRPFPGLARLWFVRLTGDVDAAMAAHGKPIRYGYLDPPFPPLDAYQTVFATVPGGAEMPSAARPFTLRTLEQLRRRNVQLASIVLHAGVSSLETPRRPAWIARTEVRATAEEITEPDHIALADHTVRTAGLGRTAKPARMQSAVAAQVGTQAADAVLYPEPFHVPPGTAEALNAARAQGRPVIAVGTTVVRALESAWDRDHVRPTAGFTGRFVHAGNPIRTVDGMLTGLHDPLASHLAMLYALVGPDLIRSSYEEAVSAGYLWHEFGDSHLLLPHAG